MSNDKKPQLSTPETAVDAAQVLYAVMKLSTNVLLYDVPTKIEGVAGFIPVYENESDAVKASCNGKFKIMAITT